MEELLIFKVGNKNDVKKDVSQEKEEKISLISIKEVKNEKR